MKITWCGHSCFLLESEGYLLALDPYSPGTVPGLAPLELAANELLCSHEHGDHCGTKSVKLLRSALRSPFKITAIPSFHDDCGGQERGKNLIHLIEAEGLRVAHMGDIGHRLTAEQLVEIGALDALMLPVGGFYTIGPLEARKTALELSARVTIPMHYRGEGFGFDQLSPLGEFLRPGDPTVWYTASALELTLETPRQIAVLRPLFLKQPEFV